MTAKQFLHSQDKHRITLSAIDQVLKAVAVTLGPKGRTVMIEESFGAPKVTKDGVTVAKSIALKDKFENMVAQLMKQGAESTVEESGDGTTTQTVLCGRFAQLGIRLVESGMDPMGLFRGMKKAVAKVIESLKSTSKPCSDFLSIEQVGTISANGDHSVGQILAKAREKVGTNGVITVQEGSGLEDELTIVEGMQLDRGYLSPHFVTNRQTGTVELDNPYILLVDKKISTVREMLGILEKVAQASKSLFIIAEDVEGEALPTLILNNLRGIVKVCAVKAPGFGDRRKEILKDIAILTKADVISEEIGLSLDKAGIENLGSAKRVLVDKDNFTIIDGAGGKDEIEARINEIRAQVNNPSISSYEKEKAEERMAKLSGGVGVIKVGAATEVEMKEKEARVRDALHATLAAIQEGIIPGGGVALLKAAQSLKGLKGDNADETAGISIIAQGIQAPFYQIIQNAGGEAAVIAHNLLEGAHKAQPNYGYNSATGEYGDMLDMGIVDPTKVARVVVEKANSIAGMLITTACMIAELPKDEDANGAGGMHSGGMGGGMDMM